MMAFFYITSIALFIIAIILIKTTKVYVLRKGKWRLVGKSKIPIWLWLLELILILTPFINFFIPIIMIIVYIYEYNNSREYSLRNKLIDNILKWLNKEI